MRSLPGLEGSEAFRQESGIGSRFLRREVILQLRSPLKSGYGAENVQGFDVVGLLGEVFRQGFADIVSDFALNLKHCHEVKVRVRSVEEGVYELAFLRDVQTRAIASLGLRPNDSASLLMNTAQELPWTFIGLETSMNSSIEHRK